MSEPLKKVSEKGVLICPPSPCPECGNAEGIMKVRSEGYFEARPFDSTSHICPECSSEWYSEFMRFREPPKKIRLGPHPDHYIEEAK